MTGELTLRYDPEDRYARARVAAIVRGDDESLRSVLFAVTERLRRVARCKDDVAGLSDEAALVVLDWIDDELDGLPLTLEGE